MSMKRGRWQKTMFHSIHFLKEKWCAWTGHKKTERSRSYIENTGNLHWAQTQVAIMQNIINIYKHLFHLFVNENLH
jgi:hypothetical protein